MNGGDGELMKTKEVAVIGCGAIATSEHIPAYMKNAGAHIKYFCDILPERAQAMADKYGSGTAVEDYHSFLHDPEVQAVSVCTPNHLHEQVSVDFLRAGKNVLCEKPAARTYAAALAMQKARDESGKILNIGVVNRFNSAVTRIKKLIDGGALGEVYHVYASFRKHRAIPGLGGAFTTKEIAGGGVLIDWGVHFLDLIMFCCGDPAPLTVSGKAFCQLGRSISDYSYVDMWAGPPVPGGIYDVDDFVTGFIRTQGPTLSLNGAWAQNIDREEMYVDFMGSAGGIHLDYMGGFVHYTAKDGDLLSITPSYPVVQPYEQEIDAFLQEIDDGVKRCSDIDCALITSKIIQALYDSSAQSQEITL